MLEHVGLPQYDTYFAKVHDLLAPDGVALIHTIGQSGRAVPTNPWLEKYIFPGSYAPSLSEIAAAVDHSSFVVCDVEALRLHYAFTLKAWRENLLRKNTQCNLLEDKRFTKMWTLYLAWMQAAFRNGTLLVYQLQLSKNLDTLPLTREYQYRN
jgi:cyclopropane-fatty-acyl-phospholipid synthase